MIHISKTVEILINKKELDIITINLVNYQNIKNYKH